MLSHNIATTYDNNSFQALQPQPVFVVEAVPGGFIVTGNGGRQVARNVHAVARLLREWAPKPVPVPSDG